jgi:hypothetical protein
MHDGTPHQRDPRRARNPRAREEKASSISRASVRVTKAIIDLIAESLGGFAALGQRAAANAIAA